jgi:hypothetical protein
MTTGMTTPSKTASALKMDPRLEDAIVRGEVVRQRLATAEGGSISTAEAARRLGISEATALRRWHCHRLVGWRHGKAVRFPVWQFAGGQMLGGIEEILQILDSDDQWRVMLYFLGNRRSLAGRRPLDLLRGGKVAEAVNHAKAYAAENTW